MRIRTAGTFDAEDLLAIYSPIINETAISFELEPPSVEEFAGRIGQTLERYPWLVCEEDGIVIGYAYAGPHRARPAYAWSVESSVYVGADWKRRGIARQLYRELFDRLRETGFFNVYAGITLPNEGSVRLHRSLGFEEVGVYRQVGYKFDRWHDVAWFGLRLRPREDRPSDPPGR